MNRIFIFLTFALAQHPLFAQNSIEKKTVDSLHTVPLENIIVTAIRADKNSPVPELTVNRNELLKTYTGQEVPVVLSQTPSVTWYSDGGHYTGYSYMRLRGIDQTRINFTLNGVPLNEPEDQGVYFANFPDFINSVQSVQVQRGVGTSTQGTASFGGSVNFESPSLTDSASADLQTSVGSYGTYRISPQFNTGLLKNGLAFYGRYSIAATDGFRYNSGSTGQSLFLSGGYFGKKSVLKFTGFSGRAENEMAYLAVSKQDLKTDYRINYLGRNETDKFKQTLAMLQYSYALGKHGTVSASAYYNFLKGGYDIYIDPDLYNFSVKSHFTGAFVNFSYEKNRLTFLSGLHSNYYVRNHYLYLKPDLKSDLYTNAGYKTETSAFTKISYALTNDLNVFAHLQWRTAGFRYEQDDATQLDFNTVTWQFINTRAGVTYSVTENFLAYASIGQTGREPTRNDMFAGSDNIDDTNYDNVSDFKKVKPEKVLDVEGGVKFNFERIKVNVNIFSMNFTNEIAAIGQLSYIGLPLRKNIKSSYRRGVEISVDIPITKNVLFNVQAVISTNRIKEYVTEYDTTTYRNVEPLLTPKIISNHSIEYTVKPWLTFSVAGRYLDRSYLDNTNNTNFTTPSSYVINASSTIQIRKKITMILMANNLTNQKYYTSGYVVNGESNYFAMALRNYFVTVRYTL